MLVYRRIEVGFSCASGGFGAGYRDMQFAFPTRLKALAAERRVVKFLKNLGVKVGDREGEAYTGVYSYDE